jgi:hypothetical protein
MIPAACGCESDSMTFTDLQLPPDLIAALSKQQISEPTPVQSAALPVLQTQQGARASANLYSLVSCSRVNGLEPYAYLRYLFEELPKASTAEALEALLPWNVTLLLRTSLNRTSTVSIP